MIKEYKAKAKYMLKNRVRRFFRNLKIQVFKVIDKIFGGK